MILVLPESLRNQLSAHANASVPRECCGFLLGREHDESFYVSEVVPVQNSAPGMDRYAMTPESVLGAHQTALARHLRVVASYHSHPNGEAIPSDLDRAEAVPGMLQVILRTTGTAQARAWMLAADGVFESIPMTTSSS